MKQIGERMRILRDRTGLSQAKLAKEFGATQSAINRYEHGQSTPTVELFRKYADYFNVSMDYIFCRTDEPKGGLYSYQEPLNPATPEMEQFVEMCFDPDSPMNGRLKDTILRMLRENTQN